MRSIIVANGSFLYFFHCWPAYLKEEDILIKSVVRVLMTVAILSTRFQTLNLKLSTIVYP